MLKQVATSVAVLVLLLAGCGDDDGDSASGTEVETPAPERPQPSAETDGADDEDEPVEVESDEAVPDEDVELDADDAAYVEALIADIERDAHADVFDRATAECFSVELVRAAGGASAIAAKGLTPDDFVFIDSLEAEGFPVSEQLRDDVAAGFAECGNIFGLVGTAFGGEDIDIDEYQDCIDDEMGAPVDYGRFFASFFVFGVSGLDAAVEVALFDAIDVCQPE